MPVSDLIYQYDGTEEGAPGASWTELLTDSVISAVDQLEADIAAVPTLADSGWVNISTFGTGWAGVGGYTPRVRRVGDRVDLAGALVRSGTSGDAGDLLTIPVGFRLTGAYTTNFVGVTITSGGQGVQLLLNTVAHKLQIPLGYATASIGSGIVLPLDASWYVN